MASAMDCTGGETEHYVSLAVSKDSDDEDAVTTFMTASKSFFQDPESLNYVEFPKPVSPTTAKDLSEALMGDYSQAQVYSPDNTLIGIPDPRILQTRVKNIRHNTQVELLGKVFHPCLPLIVKLELFPLGTALEIIATLVLLLAWWQLLFAAGSGVIFAIVGGLSFFVGSTLMHFWYGFTRYQSWSRGFTAWLKGDALDVFFEKTRDICSRQCHGADWNSSEKQRGRRSAWILLLSLPFTLVHHISSIVAYGLHRGVQCVRQQSEPEASVRFSLLWGTHLANLLLALTWMTKSRMAMTYCVATFVLQQRVYSALLFRRNWKGFVSSLLLGGLLVATPVATTGLVATTRQNSQSQKADGEDEESTESNAPIELQEVTHIPSMDEQPDDTYRASNTSFRHGIAGEEADENDDSSRFSQQDRITVSNAQPKTKPSDHNGRCDPETLWNDWDDGLKLVCIKFGSGVGDEEVKSRSLKISNYEQESAARPVSTVASSEYEYDPEADYDSILEDDDYSDSTEDSMSKPKTIAVAHGRSGVSQLAPPALPPLTSKKVEEKPEDDSRRSFSQRMLKYLPLAIRPNTYNADDSSEKSSMEPNDVYIQVGGNKFTQIESHSGTVAWRKAIQETTRKFHKSPSFGDAHFRYVMKLLEGADRDWYMGSMEYGWMKLNAAQIRARCKDAYKKQLETDEEISTIYSEISKASLTKEQQAKGTPVGMIPFLVNDDAMAADRSIKTSATDKNMPRIEVEYHGENEAEDKKKRRGIIGRLIKPKHPQGVKETFIQPDKSEMAATPKKQRKLLVYLGKKDNHGYHQFLKSLRTVTGETQQSKDTTEEDYTVFMHKSVIAKTRATQYLIKNASGIFEPAGEGQVFDFAWQHYHASRSSTTVTTPDMATRDDKEAVKPKKSGPLKKMLAVRALSSMTGDYKLKKKRTEQTIEMRRQELPPTKEQRQDATPEDDEQSITQEILEDIQASETAEMTIADRGLIRDDEFVQSIADKLSKDETDLVPSQQQPQRSRPTNADSEVAEMDRLTGRAPSRLLGSMALGRMISKGRSKQNQQQQRAAPITEEEIEIREPSGIRLQRLVEETNAEQARLDEGEVAAALRDDPPVEDSIALSADSSPHEAPKGLKRILSLGRPRASADKLPGMIEPLQDEASRKDPEQVKAWMAKNRTKSKFLRGLWAKVALKRRRRGEEVDSRNSTIPQYAISPSSPNNDPSNNKNKPSFYDELMEVLALEYRRATGQRGGLSRAIDEDEDSYSEDDILNYAGHRSRGASFGDDEQTEYPHGDSSTITSYEDEGEVIPPQTLLQFVERKIEDEVLYSNTCLGMDLCDDFQRTMLDEYGAYCGDNGRRQRHNEFVF